MTTQEFWNIIVDSRSEWNLQLTTGNMDRQLARLKTLLSRLTPEEIIAFKDWYTQYHFAAYSHDLWAVAYLVNGGCSDDGFHYFRDWLISMGKDVYETGMADADLLVGVFTSPDLEIAEFEEFGYVAAEAYEAKTGQELPPRAGKHPTEPTGQPWAQKMKVNEAELGRRFPKVYAAFGDEDE